MKREKFDKLYPPRTRSQVSLEEILNGEWFGSCDGKWRKSRPPCPEGIHTFSEYGGYCINCEYSLQPAAETATGR